MKSESMKIVFLHILISAENSDTENGGTENSNTESRSLYSPEREEYERRKRYG